MAGQEAVRTWGCLVGSENSRKQVKPKSLEGVSHVREERGACGSSCLNTVRAMTAFKIVFLKKCLDVHSVPQNGLEFLYEFAATPAEMGNLCLLQP